MPTLVLHTSAIRSNITFPACRLTAIHTAAIRITTHTCSASTGVFGSTVLASIDSTQTTSAPDEVSAPSLYGFHTLHDLQLRIAMVREQRHPLSRRHWHGLHGLELKVRRKIRFLESSSRNWYEELSQFSKVM